MHVEPASELEADFLHRADVPKAEGLIDMNRRKAFSSSPSEKCVEAKTTSFRDQSLLQGAANSTPSKYFADIERCFGGLVICRSVRPFCE